MDLPLDGAFLPVPEGTKTINKSSQISNWDSRWLRDSFGIVGWVALFTSIAEPSESVLFCSFMCGFLALL
jgi:hypothetical protein